ncbi:MAG TPA: carboxymuconolactone decarboxylase family protein [Caulobacteraceae bacterium]|jgi:alkylhydroperoxidase family enzyme
MEPHVNTHPQTRPAGPRIAPLEPEAWDSVVREILAPEKRPAAYGEPEQPVFNVFKTMANYPALMKRIAPWGSHVLFKSSLPGRDLERAILRTAWVCQTPYEWAHHRAVALQTGVLSVADVEAVRAGPAAPGLSAHDAAVLAAADELVSAHCISDATWARLALGYDTLQLMDLVFAVGHYAMMCMALNSFGVQLEDDLTA